MFKRILCRFTRTASVMDLRQCAAAREAKRRINDMIRHEMVMGLRGQRAVFAV